MLAGVLDASALLAMLLEEPGGDKVAEVLGRLARDGTPDDALAGVEARLRPSAVPFEAMLTVETGRLIRVARGLSPGDRACVATAKHLGLPVITAAIRYGLGSTLVWRCG